MQSAKRGTLRILCWLRLALVCATLAPMVVGQQLAADRSIGQLEVVSTFNGAMPTGVTVSDNGRVFVNFPKWGDDVAYTVAEVKDGKTVPYPEAGINHYSQGDKPRSLSPCRA
jgi:hypothetical protein